LKDVQSQNGKTVLTMTMKTRMRPGTVTKKLMLQKGHNAVYCSHTMAGYSGKMNFGHHAILSVPAKPGSLLFSSSPIRFGCTSPSVGGAYAAGEYACLPAKARFRDLAKVPTIWKDKPFSNRTVFPSEDGFTDICAIFPRPGIKIAWNAAAFPDKGFVWFSLRDPKVLTSTVLWMSNLGRHASPWNGRNRCLGIEDVCAYFADGLKNSVKANFLSRQGIKTNVTLFPKKPFEVKCIQGVARIPKGFDRVKTVTVATGSIELRSASGKKVRASVQTDFLEMGR
jgi:hypothetical protein